MAPRGEHLDLAVVDAGVAGSLVAYRGAQLHPDWTSGLFERTRRIGGRLHSTEDHHDVEIVDDEGAVLARRRLPECIEGIARLHALIAICLPEECGQHPDAEIYASQPGLGVILAARVLGEFGDDSHRYADAKARKNYACTSPVTRASGRAAWFVANHYAVEGTAAHDPAFGHDQADSHDIGVIDYAGWAQTPADVWSFTPATLPTAGQLTELGSRALEALDWIVVGYGTQEAARGPGGQTHPGGGVR